MNNWGSVDSQSIQGKHIKRILFTGDFFRPNAAGTNPTQHHNIRWLRNLLENQLKMATGFSSSTICWNGGGVNDGLMGYTDISRIYRAYGMNCSIKSWGVIHNSDKFPRRVEDLLRHLFADSLVVGFETPPVLARFFENEGIPHIAVSLHPVRFLDDLLLGFKSNVPSIQEAIFKYCIDEAYIHTMAGLQKAAGARGDNSPIRPGSALFLMQTWYDQSQLRDGEFVTPSDFLDEIMEFAKAHSELLVKEHPMEPNPATKIMAGSIPNMRIISSNVYRVMSRPEVISVGTLSSSTGSEANYFGKSSKFFLREPMKIRTSTGGDQDGFIGVQDAFLTANFWRDTLSSILPVSKYDKVSIPFKPNRLRTSIRSFWGFNEIDTDIPASLARRT